MRYLFLLSLLLISLGAKAGTCEEVPVRSHGRISCVEDEFGYTLKYHDWLARQLTLRSGQYATLIDSLCIEGGIIRETWPQPFGDTQIRTIHCIAGNQ